MQVLEMIQSMKYIFFLQNKFNIFFFLCILTLVMCISVTNISVSIKVLFWYFMFQIFFAD
jgi:hypothetical protein